jgi:uncharacterized protein
VGYLERRRRLDECLQALESVAVAFSGGVDSTVLLHAAHRNLGERAVGVIADSASLPRRELAAARELAAQIGAALVEVRTHELADARYVSNSGQRCYFCKSALFETMERWARRAGIASLAFGEIVDDLSDDRPGARAASERRVVAPLREAGFTKADVRRYACEAGLAVADKPASACLASRVPHGTAVTAERLATIERAEERLAALGLRVLRVRHHGLRARVEVGAEELESARSRVAAIAAALAAEGFARFDLAVYGDPPDSVASRWSVDAALADGPGHAS